MKLISLLLFGASLFAQGVQYQTTIIINNPPPGNYSPNFISQSKIFVNTTTYTDATLGTPCANGTPIVLPNTSICVANPSTSNIVAFWLEPGTYSFTIQLPAGQILGPFPFTTSGTPATPQFPASVFVKTVSTLPAPGSGNINYVYLVTDGQNNADCSVGGGSTPVWCLSNGTSYSAIGSQSGSVVSSFNTRTGAVTYILNDLRSVFSGCSGSELLTYAGTCTSGSGLTGAGNLSPIFTTSVSGSTLNFSLTNASGFSWFGNSSSVTGAPSYNTSALPSSLIPTPGASSLGGVESISNASHQWLNSLSTMGIFGQSQPGFGDLSGSASCSQLPALTGDSTTTAGSCATTTSKINGTTYNQSLISSTGYATGGGTANAQTVTLSPAISSYTVGLIVRWLPIASNTSASPTLNVNGVGADIIFKNGGSSLANGDIDLNIAAEAMYIGSNSWNLLNPQTASSGGSGFIQTLTAPVAANFTQFNYNTGSGVTTTQIDNSSPVTSISLTQQDPSNTQNIAALGKSKLASIFTVTIGFTSTCLSTDGFTGIWIYDGTTNMIIAGYQCGSGNGLRISLFTGFATYSADVLAPQGGYFYPTGPMTWFRIQETASNRIYSVSADGINFTPAAIESNTAHFTTADYGIALEPRTGGVGTMQATMYSFTESNP